MAGSLGIYKSVYIPSHGKHELTPPRAQYSADWGDYISFAQRLREKADEKGVDLLVVDCGDRVDGNGLYDASTPKGKYTYSVIKEQHIDVITTGNHELYQAETAAREYDQTVPNFHGNYLASNLDYLNPKTGERIAMAQRYRTFTTKNLGLKVVAFGFLFDFTGNANNTFVQPVSETVKEKWFQDAIMEEADLFLVAGHVTLNGPEYDAIFRAIRKRNWDTPIHFFGGHSHIRSYHKYDSKAVGIQAGRYLETIGWASINGISKKKQSIIGGGLELRSFSKSLSFGRRYIDTNLYGYHYHTGMNGSTFPTENGKNVSSIINSSRTTLKLDHTFGCAPRDLWLNRAPYPSENSLLTWLDQEVMPDIVVNDERKNVPRLAMTNSGAMRFDIFKGAFTTDTTYIISPFVSKFRYIKDVPYKSAKRLYDMINTGGPIFEAKSLTSLYLSPPEQLSTKSFDTVTTNNVVRELADSQHLLTSSQKPALIPGYTTSDAAGTDGDDTVHSPINFYRVPNVVQSKLSFPKDGEPEKVDVVYIDFIQPWILVALSFLGETRTSADTLSYRSETLTDLMASWIKEHWRSDC